MKLFNINFWSKFILLILFISQFSTSSNADELWREKWFMHTIWYQIFPDRFYTLNISGGKFITDQYNQLGEPIYLPLTPWDNQKATPFNKYGGSLNGIIEKLPYLKNLGIKAIWLNPIFTATSNHRYNTADYIKIDPLLGDEEDFKELINEAHKLKIKIILDGVFNHTGYEFWAFQDLIKNGASSPYKDWYIIKSFPIIPLWKQNEKNKANYECWWGIGSLPKLNYKNLEVQNYIYNITQKWMKLGIDGWRLDVPQEIKEIDFWVKWCNLVRDINPQAFIVGEIWDEARAWVNSGYKFDAVMNYYGFREPVLKFFAAEKIKISQFDQLLKQRRNLYHHKINCAMLNLLGSHDTARILSAIYNKDSKDADKEKKNYLLGEVTSETIKKTKIVYLFQFTYIGSPIIYYGDEVGMYGGKDPDCRKPMLWDEEKQNLELLEWIKKLIKIRNNEASLQTGSFKTLFYNDQNNIYAYQRKEGKEKIIIAFNYSSNNYFLKMNVPKKEYFDLISENKLIFQDNKLKINLQPYSGMILK